MSRRKLEESPYFLRHKQKFRRLWDESSNIDFTQKNHVVNTYTFSRHNLYFIEKQKTFFYMNRASRRHYIICDACI